MGEHMTDEEIEEMMEEADKDGDGQISFPGNHHLQFKSNLQEFSTFRGNRISDWQNSFDVANLKFCHPIPLIVSYKICL